MLLDERSYALIFDFWWTRFCISVSAGSAAVVSTRGRAAHHTFLMSLTGHMIAGVIISDAAGEKVWSFDKRDYTAANVSLKVRTRGLLTNS